MSKKDWIAIAGVTLLFAFLVYFGLGCKVAPESMAELTNEEKKNEVIIDLGKEQEVSSLQVFLGYKNDPTVYLSYYDENLKTWETVGEGQEIHSVFAWNSLEFQTTCRYIGLVLKSEYASIGEIVVLDSDGNQITGVSAKGYDALFDEQNLYPKDNSYYYQTMFDEVYHGRTAYEFLHRLPIYENTHPPLGKSIISLGIKVFGMNPFGWRFMVALFGVLSIPLMYAFAYKMAERWDVALMASILLMTEFMHFTLSRIATIDIIVAVFILMSFYFIYAFGKDLLYRQEGVKRLSIDLFLCGISCALAISTKWTGFYSSLGVAVLLFGYLITYTVKNGGIKENFPLWCKLAGVCVVCFVVIPFTVYLLSYIPFQHISEDQSLFRLMADNAKSMLSYHEGVRQTHPYSSRWYQWPVDSKPLLDAWDSLSNGKVSAISTFLNPLVAFGGLVALVHNGYLALRKKNMEGATLLVCYLAMLVPWMFIKRTTFIYQYFVCSMILILMIANSVRNIEKEVVSARMCIITSCISIVLFMVFYPVISGMAVSYNYLKFLQWLPTWAFT
ncbi:MAG: phospholipid carrier-dependent glycosyltransferase [Lachnospiraceae bacterium]|nr:phospholipid carrier-dependent glycosyltransferase [Lachnospiraceae bacterium]